MFEESARTFKDTWGESIDAMGTIDVVTVLLVLGGVALGVLTFVVTAGLGTIGLLLTIIVGGSAVNLAPLVVKALTGVAKTALYVSATDRTAPEYFEDTDFGELGGDGTSAGGRRTGSGRGTI